MYLTYFLIIIMRTFNVKLHVLKEHQIIVEQTQLQTGDLLTNIFQICKWNQTFLEVLLYVHIFIFTGIAPSPF